MPRTFSYKDGSIHNHKMAQKFMYNTYDEDTYTQDSFKITNGSERAWKKLNKIELMEIPWMKEVINSKGAKLFIDDCLGFNIKEVDDDGCIYLTTNGMLQIHKNSIKPSRFELIEFYRNEENIWTPDYPRDIRCATVSTNFGTLSDGFRVFTDGPKKYYYKKDGTPANFVCPFEENCFGYCCSDDY